jgi:hypothetical protein
MKKSQMNALARSLCEYLSSRNNDITGYCGLGILCAASRRDGRPRMSFRITPGEPIRIYSCELTDSTQVTDRLVERDLDAIEGRLSFVPSGRFPHGVARYTCTITVAISQGGRIGLGMCQVECWPHDPARERRRATMISERRPSGPDPMRAAAHAEGHAAIGISTGGFIQQQSARQIVSLMLAVVGVIHVLPLTGVLGAPQLTALYGGTFDEPNLAILMRHRAVLFGVLGGGLLLAALRPAFQGAALAAGFASVLSFLYLAGSVGDYNAQLNRVVMVDVVALACLSTAALARAYGNRRG